MTTLDTVQAARRKNLIDLIARNNDEHGRGGILAIARRLGYKWSGFVSQMRSRPGATGHKRMTEATARAIEAAFLLPVDAMDEYPLPAEGAGADRGAVDNRLLVVLAAAADRAGVHLPASKLASAMTLMQSADRADAEYADTVVSLLR